MKIRIFTLRSKNIEQGTRKEEGTGKQSNNRTLEQFNNGTRNGEVRSGNWQHPALPCCSRNEIPLLQLFLMRSSIRVKILISFLRNKKSKQEVTPSLLFLRNACVSKLFSGSFSISFFLIFKTAAFIRRNIPFRRERQARDACSGRISGNPDFSWRIHAICSPLSLFAPASLPAAFPVPAFREAGRTCRILHEAAPANRRFPHPL